MEMAVFVLSGQSRVVNNTSADLSGHQGGVAVVDSGQARIEGGSMVCSNKCLHMGGSGMFVDGMAELALVDGAVVCDNFAGFGAAGMLVAGNATVTVRNTSISGNVAYGSGGGFAAAGNASVSFFDSTITNNTSMDGGGLLPGGWGGGRIAASDNANVQMYGGTRMLGKGAVGNGGASPLT
jgi:hypothetical protein